MRIRQIARLAGIATIAAASLVTTLAMAQDSRPYTMGAVSQVTSIRTKPGMFDEYVKFLAGPFRQEQDELKKLGIVTDYSFYGTEPRTPHDPDLYIVVTFKNMAAMDAAVDKADEVDKKVFGSLKQTDKSAMDREAIREILGTETIRELKIK